MNNRMMSSQINLARPFTTVTSSNLEAGEKISMQHAVKRTCALYWQRYGIKPTTLSISIGWWRELHEFFTGDLSMSYSSKYVPVTFGCEFSTHFNVGCMDSEIDPIQKGKLNMPKRKKSQEDFDIESALNEIEDDDDELFDIAAALSAELPATVDDDIVYVVEFDAYSEGDERWVTYEFEANQNGSLVINDDGEVLMAWLYGKVNKKGRMKKPRLAVIWKDQPNSVYTWPIYVDTLYNIIAEEKSLADYIADNLAIGEDMEHEFFSYQDFASMMSKKFGVDILS